MRQMHNSALEELEELHFQATLNSSGNHNNNDSLFFELEESEMKPLSLSSPGAFSMDYEEGGEEEGGGEVEQGGKVGGGGEGNWTIEEEDDVFEEGGESDKLLKEDSCGNGVGAGGDAVESKYRKVRQLYQ